MKFIIATLFFASFSNLYAQSFQIRHFENRSEFNSLPIKDYNVFELDQMENIGKQAITSKFRGKKIICYFSASYEAWRSDAAQFPNAAKGTKISGWDELWGNITRADLQKFLEKRFERCQNVGAHFVEIDNTDISRNKTGFNISDQSNLAALLSLSKTAKKYNLGLFLKNTGYLAPALAQHFSGSLNEECMEHNECHELRPFVQLGKPVLQVEYDQTFCRPYKGHKVQYKSDYFGVKARECL